MPSSITKFPIVFRSLASLFFRTDGDVFPLIPDFIELGVDILNPVQTLAGKMSNLEELKKQFGKNIIFYGAIDTHRILPIGTPAEVRAEVKRIIENLGQRVDTCSPLSTLSCPMRHLKMFWRWWRPRLSSAIMTDLRDGMEIVLSLSLPEVPHVC